LATAAISARHSSRLATRALADAYQGRQIDAIIHFTSRYLDLAKDGERFDDEDWLAQYWGLLATEFYFFENGWLPPFMFQLWMIELVSRGYDSSPEIWASHERHLERFYAVNYERMYKFFWGLHQLSQDQFTKTAERNRAIDDYTARCISAQDSGRSRAWASGIFRSRSATGTGPTLSN
jgi:hypothetical protein